MFTNVFLQRPALPSMGLYSLGFFLALTLHGCATDGLLRMAGNADDLASVEGAWTTPEGGVVVSARLALGTFRATSHVLAIGPTELAAAFAAAGQGSYRLPRSAVRPGVVTPDAGHAALPVVEVMPHSFDWRKELPGLRPPEGAERAIFYQGRGLILFNLRPVRLAHVRALPDGRFESVLFELEPEKGGGRALYYLPVPVTAVVEAFGVILLLGLVVGLAPLL